MKADAAGKPLFELAVYAAIDVGRGSCRIRSEKFTDRRFALLDNASQPV
jgi:hypothetical protein